MLLPTTLIPMEEEENLEGLIVPDSYQSEEEKCDAFDSQLPNLSFQVDDTAMSSLSPLPELATKIPTTSISCERDKMEDDDDDKKEVDDDDKIEDDEEEKIEEEVGEEIKEEKEDECYKFYMVWFEDFVARYGLDIKHLDLKSSSIQQLEKSWLNKQLSITEVRYKYGQLELDFINSRYAIIKKWLSSF